MARPFGMTPQLGVPHPYWGAPSFSPSFGERVGTATDSPRAPLIRDFRMSGIRRSQLWQFYYTLAVGFISRYALLGNLLANPRAGWRRCANVIFIFIRSLFSHTFSYVGAALVLAGALEKILNKRLLLPPKWLVVAGLVCLFVGGSQAWKDEHKNTETVIAQRKQAEIGNNALRSKLDESRSQLEFLKTHQAVESDKKQKERATIAGLIEDGNHLMEECLLKHRNDADLADRANRWEADAMQQLAAFDPSLAARFKTAVGTPFVHAPVSGANDVVWNFVNNRVQALASILHDLND